MPTVNTILGTISPAELGTTLIHEHVVFREGLWDGPFDRKEAVRTTVSLFERLRSCGVRTFVDVTSSKAVGREPELLREIADKTAINIVCATGFQKVPRTASRADALRVIYDTLVSEISEGINGTGIRPGVIKLFSSKGAFTAYEEMFFQAAARVQKETGVPIVTHTEAGTLGPEQAEILIAEGANPKRVVIGHMGENVDVDYHLRTLSKGVSIAFDRMGVQGLPGSPMDSERYPMIVRLIASGYANQIFLSQDYVVNYLREPRPNDTVDLVLASRHPAHLFETVIPTLKSCGVTDAQIDTMLVDNPQRLFGRD